VRLKGEANVHISSIRIAVLALVLLSASIHAQWLNYPTPGVPRLRDGRPNLDARAPRTADGKPDLSGLWEAEQGKDDGVVAGGARIAPEFINIAARLPGGLPLRPWALELRTARQVDLGKDHPEGLCLPLSIVQMHSHPLPRKILQLPHLIAILYEKGSEFRQIFTDGRPLPTDPDPSWRGYSTGKWQGDTLVVQTIGFRDGLWADGDGHPLTDVARITERFRRPNYGTLEIEVTVDDTKAYTAPWTVKINQHIKLDTDLLEYVCLENEQDRPNLVGK
jgi:hypothetical protein